MSETPAELYERVTRRTPSLVTHREDEFRYYTEGARLGVLLIRDLPDVVLLAVARHELESSDYPTEYGPGGQRQPVMMRSAFRTVLELVDDAGDDRKGLTNPSWLLGGAAEEAYDRGLIDEVELDRITR